MNIVQRFLSYAFQTVIFLLALLDLFMVFSHYNDLIDTSTMIVSEDTMIKEQYNEIQGGIISKSDLIASMMINIEIDYQIIDENNTYMISADDYSPEHVSYYSFGSDKYKKSYEYDLKGKTVKIIFQYID